MWTISTSPCRRVVAMLQIAPRTVASQMTDSCVKMPRFSRDFRGSSRRITCEQLFTSNDINLRERNIINTSFSIFSYLAKLSHITTVPCYGLVGLRRFTSEKLCGFHFGYLYAVTRSASGTQSIFSCWMLDSLIGRYS